MSIRIRNAAGINTVSNSVIGCGQDRLGVSWRMRVNAPPNFTRNQRFVQSPAFLASLYGFNGAGGYMNLNMTVTATDATAVVSTAQRYALNIVNHFLLAYDKDDATKQGLYLNGVKIPFARTASGQTKTASGQTYTGFYQDPAQEEYDYEMEDLVVWHGYCPTLADALALLDGADPTTVGAAATQRFYWPLSGTPGTNATAGDAGLADQYGSTYAMRPFIGTSYPSSVVYGDAMPFGSQAVCSRPTIMSSGETLMVSIRNKSTNGWLPIVAGSIATPPTLVVEGATRTLKDPLYTGSHSGVLFKIDGDPVPKDAAGTFSAADGWFTTAYGVGPRFDAAPLLNKAGRPTREDDAIDVRLGLNSSAGSSYWAADYGPKNLALRIAASATNATYRADGTIMSNLSTAFFSTGNANPFDDTGTPRAVGKYLVMYRDRDLANNTDITISASPSSFPIPELTAYRNDGATNGGVKARVYDVAAHPTFGAALAADVTSASQTSFVLDGVAGITTSRSQRMSIGGEWVAVTAVNTGTKTVTVTRAQYGTTAATYTAGTPVSVEFCNPYPDLWVNITAASGAPNYEDLVILGPDDWTPPDPPAPIVMPITDEMRRGVNEAYARAMAPGLGVIRHMDSTMGGFDQTSEPEHQRLDSDLFPSRGVKLAVSFHQQSSRAATLADCPYHYTPRYQPLAEKFGATLGADITTSPAPGTVEAITISDAVAVNLCYPLRIELPSGEVVRIVSYDGSGTQVQVARGADMTTPQPCAAGPVLVRYRVPITTAAQIEVNEAALIEITTDAPHGLWPDSWPVLSQSSDTNPMARIDVTLTAAAGTTVDGAGQSTLSVSVAEADAPYLVRGLGIYFDAELVGVVSASLGAPSGGVCTGTIVVARHNRGTAIAPHASGTVGKGRSGGALLALKDGSATAWCEKSTFATPVFITGPRSFLCTFGLAGSTGQPWVHVGVQPRDTTPQLVNGVDQAAGGMTVPRSSYSYEHVSRVAQLAPGCDVWINIPYGTTDDGVYAIAKSVLSGLDATHRVLIESGNEVWNTGSSAQPWSELIQRGSFLGGFSNEKDMWVYQSGRQCAAFRRQADAMGWPGQVKHVLAYQQGGVGTPLARARALGVDVDVCSTAPYFKAGSTAAHAAWANTATDGQICDMNIFDIQCDSSGANGPPQVADGAARTLHEQLTGRELEFIHYEGGLGTAIPVPSTTPPVPPIDDWLLRAQDVYYSPTRRFAEFDYPLILRDLANMARPDNPGKHGLCLFNACQPYFAWGSWTDAQGHPTALYYAQWGATVWWGQPAGNGDGSDGKFDNRTCLRRPGQPGTKLPWVNQDALCVSTRLQGIKNYNAAYAAYQPGGGGGPAVRPYRRFIRGLHRAQGNY